jgi:soluble lytic murein transglycosylase
VDALGARDDATRQQLADRIVVYLQRSPSASDAKQALEILDRLTGTKIDELALARATASTSPPRAVAGFARLASTQALSPADRMLYASALARSNRSGEASRVYATITDDATLAPNAAYQRARMQLQAGDGASARTGLRAVATQYANVKLAAAPALLLLADLQVDDNDFNGAAQSLHALVAQYPDASQAPLARFRAGLLAWRDSPAVAAAQFDSLAALFPKDDESVPAKYWAARALDRAGRGADAKARWQDIIRTTPLSYYAMRSAQHLGVSGWTMPATTNAPGRTAAIDSAAQRIATLRRLGMDVEARFELDALAERAVRVPGEALAVAKALSSAGDASRALRTALASIERGESNAELFRLAYPVLHEDALRDESNRNGLDPALVAGLIRQESSWNPHALSAANARGLMQVLPPVGASIATAKRYPMWNTVLLYQPDVNIELGTAHLATSLRKDVPVERALAAYNAGVSRVVRWTARPNSDDAEMFTEWIPFAETRDYVRIVLRNAAIYKAAYSRQ